MRYCGLLFAVLLAGAGCTTANIYNVTQGTPADAGVESPDAPGEAGDAGEVPADASRADVGPGTADASDAAALDDAGGDASDAAALDAGSEAGPAPPVVNTTTETVNVDGVERQYVLSVPKAYDAGRSYPLIVALHGDGSDAAGFASQSKLEAATGGLAVIAYPNGSVDLFTPYDQNRDQKLIEFVINAVKGNYSIDASKVWGFGYSKGGYQLNELACKKPGLLKAMAVHAGGAPQSRDGNGNVDCPSAVGLPTFVTHGGNDDPGGGEYGAQYWASRAGCQSSRTPSTPAMCEAYTGCSTGKPVVFCVVPDHPHYPMYENAGADSWAFFENL